MLPACLDRSYALDEKIKVDIYLPGCPPHPDWIGEAIVALLEGRAPQLPNKSVCDTCPTIKTGKGNLKHMNRFTHNAHYDPGKPVSDMHCLLEQGLQCMGAVTRGGCAGKSGEAPRCIHGPGPLPGMFRPGEAGGQPVVGLLERPGQQPDRY